MIRRLLLAIAALTLLAGCENQPLKEQHGCVRPKVIAFTAAWCGPCREAKPYLVQVEAAGVEVEIVDIDEHPESARQYGVTSVPTFFVYVCGKKAVRTQDITVVVALTRFGCK
ncbi:MAG: thioredoxin family protein [Bryobacteraceae bacterium]|nr:thioredoxin family protein [Bryobacteraceae bacterium]